MDGLELSVSDGRLGDRGQRIVVAEGAEVGDEVFDVPGRRRDESCRARVVGAATDPVLLLTEAPAVLFEPGPSEESLMDAEQHVGGDVVTLVDALDPVEHGVDVPEHLGGRDVRWSLVESSNHFGLEEPSCPDLQALDPRRRDGFSSQQDAGERFGVDECARFDVQSSDGRLSIGDVGGNLTVQGEGSADKRVREVRFVLTRATITACRTGEIGRPAASQNL